MTCFWVQKPCMPTLIDEGEINILKESRLTEYEFECEIPQVKHPYAVYKDGFQDAGYFMDIFKGLKVNKEPFQFIVSRKTPMGKMLLYTDTTVSMESYTIEESADNGFDFKVKFKLKQYRDYGTKTVKLKTKKKSTKKKATKKKSRSTKKKTTTAKTYKVVKGDCLWKISKKYYGDGSKYTVIYNANKKVIGGNPNLIYPGQVLTIPAV